MLTKTDWKAIPPYGKENRSPIRQFAYKTVLEFLENSEEGDVFEVTGFPSVEGNDTLRMADKVSQAMRTELWYLRKDYDMRSDVKIFRRKERLFMERTRVRKPQEPIKRNPYPGDLPRVIKPAM